MRELFSVSLLEFYIDVKFGRSSSLQVMQGYMSGFVSCLAT